MGEQRDTVSEETDALEDQFWRNDRPADIRRCISARWDRSAVGGEINVNSWASGLSSTILTPGVFQYSYSTIVSSQRKHKSQLRSGIVGSPVSPLELSRQQ